jgi:hypothetical protein
MTATRIALMAAVQAARPRHALEIVAVWVAVITGIPTHAAAYQLQAHIVTADIMTAQAAIASALAEPHMITAPTPASPYAALRNTGLVTVAKDVITEAGMAHIAHVI